ncbi:hypothetical protein KC363_g41 [Hortaea werneckii]|nr:hypothetical protein KC363_g41 [Hortaea werneckii]
MRSHMPPPSSSAALEETTFHQSPVGIAGIAANERAWWGRAGTPKQSRIMVDLHKARHPFIPSHATTMPRAPILPSRLFGPSSWMVREARHAANRGKELSASSLLRDWYDSGGTAPISCHAKEEGSMAAIRDIGCAHVRRTSDVSARDLIGGRCKIQIWHFAFMVRRIFASLVWYLRLRPP